jgi:hypothetical protein
MGRCVLTVGVLEIARRRNRAGEGPAVLVHTSVTHMTQDDAVF